MNRSPDRLNLDHLKKQAKELIRLYRSRDPAATARFRHALPAAAGRGDDDISSLGLRLHDAQSCIAREHGFVSWPDLKRYVEMQSAAQKERAVRALHWSQLIYSGDVGGTSNRANPRVALRILADDPELIAGDPYLACAIGDEGALRQATQSDPSWVNRPGGPLRLPPLFAIAHSSLLRVPEFRERLHRSAQLLIAAGADVNQRIHSRWPPASLSQPDERYPLSTLYGAAGANHDPALTRLLLDAGADPNDGESLYHSLENPACTRLLLEHGARIAESNAIYRSIDLENDTALKLLLAARRRPERAGAECAADRLGFAAVVGHLPPSAPSCACAAGGGRRSVTDHSGWRQPVPAGAAVRAVRCCGPAARADRRA